MLLEVSSNIRAPFWCDADRSYLLLQVKFNVNRVDNMVIQAIALLDTLDKDINTFVMRVREWYSWHFPELVKICADNYQYARLALFVKEKTSLNQDSLSGAHPATSHSQASVSVSLESSYHAGRSLVLA